MIGMTAGTGLSEKVLRGLTMTGVETRGKAVDVYIGALGDTEIALVPRHGVQADVAPHLIDHAANLSALRELGVSRVVAISSTGSLKASVRPPSLMVPDDYIELRPSTIHARAVHAVPSISEEVRRALLQAASSAHVRPFHDRGIYVQTVGPRFETRAEVRMLANFGDVVGMTMGSEATVARELGMEYASLCTVDNFANGVSGALAPDRIVEQARENTANAWNVVRSAVETLDIP